MNQYFPLSDFQAKTGLWWNKFEYMNSHDSGIENTYQLMDIGNEKYLFLNIETFDQFSPDQHPEYNDKRIAAMQWAKDVLTNSENSDRKVILATHNNWDTWEIRNNLLNNNNYNKNIVMSNSGHVGKREAYFKTDSSGGGSHNFVTDYQHDKWETMLIRYYIFKPLEDKVDYYTYSPITDDFEVDIDGDYSSHGSISLIQAD